MNEPLDTSSAQKTSSDSPLFGLDLRSLGLCRILAGLTIVADLISRAVELRLHYTDHGIMPVAIAMQPACTFPSIYLAFTETWSVALLMVVHGLFGLALAAGYRTSAVTVICWYLTRSLHARNHMVLNGGDVVFISLLFWAMFLPWGGRWSLDSLRRGDRPDPENLNYLSLASVLFALQLPFIYWLSLFHKIEPTWLAGDAVYYAMSTNLYARETGQVLLALPWLLAGLTYATFVWELIGPALLLTPWPRVRGLTCLAFAFMHLSFGVFLKIGIFAFTPVLFLVALTPGQYWARLLRSWQARLAWLGPRVQRLPSPPPFRVGPEMRPFLLFFAVFSVFQGVGQDSRFPAMVPDSLLWVERWTGLQQRWTVFVNLPGLNDGWVVVEGKLADGKTVDIFQGNEPVDWDRPRHHSKIHGLYRWPTPLIVIVSNSGLQRIFVQALVDDWNHRHPDRPLVEASLTFVKSPMQPGFRDFVPVRERLSEWKATP